MFQTIIESILYVHRYERIAYLDTDVGQTEFTPPGCLSLTVIDKITPGDMPIDFITQQM